MYLEETLLVTFCWWYVFESTIFNRPFDPSKKVKWSMTRIINKKRPMWIKLHKGRCGTFHVNHGRAQPYGVSTVTSDLQDWNLSEPSRESVSWHGRRMRREEGEKSRGGKNDGRRGANASSMYMIGNRNVSEGWTVKVMVCSHRAQIHLL